MRGIKNSDFVQVGGGLTQFALLAWIGRGVDVDSGLPMTGPASGMRAMRNSPANRGAALTPGEMLAALIKRFGEEVAGIYQFLGKRTNKPYVGQSGNLAQRLMQHIRNEKVTFEEAMKAWYKEMEDSTKLEREIQEQLRIQKSHKGTLDNLENERFPIGKGRKYLMPK